MLTKITRTINRLASRAADKAAGLHLSAIHRSIDVEAARVNRAYIRAEYVADMADKLYEDAEAARLRQQTLLAQAQAEIESITARLREEE